VSRKKRDFKNFALAFLLIAAIYQTGTLWLENYSGHNFFYYMSALGKSNVGENITSEALDAEYITVGYGNKMFGVLYGEKGNEIKKCADEVIKQAVDKSIIEGSEEIVLSEILDKKLAAYDLTATAFCAANSIRTYAFALKDPANILRVIHGENIGTETY